MTRTRRKPKIAPPKTKLSRARLDLVRESDGSPPQLGDARRGRLVVPIDQLYPDPRNERTEIPDVEGMASSLKSQGLLTLPSVWPRLEGGWYIEAGHRRWAAAKSLGWKSMPVIVCDPPKNLSSRDTRRFVENIQREDLTPLERAVGMRRLIEEHRYSQRDLAAALGKREQWVADQLAILKLPDRLLDQVRTSKLPLSGDALCRVARLKDPAEQTEAVKDLLGGASAGAIRQKFTKPGPGRKLSMPPSAPLFDEFDDGEVDQSTVECLVASPGRYSIEVGRRGGGRWSFRVFASFSNNVLGRQKDGDWHGQLPDRHGATVAAADAVQEFLDKAPPAKTERGRREKSEILRALDSIDKKIVAEGGEKEPAEDVKAFWRGKPTGNGPDKPPVPPSPSKPAGIGEVTFVATASSYVIVRCYDGTPSKKECLDALNEAVRQAMARKG